MKAIIRKLISNTVFANVVLVIIILTGFISSWLMVREFFPEFSVETIFVEVAYPGADPEEVEEGISRKIEEQLDGLEGIKRYTTVSSENIGRAIVEVREDYPVDEVYDRVRNAVDSISTFPVDAEKPILSQLTLRNEVLYLALWGNQNERVMKEWAERIKDELQQLPGLSQVTIFGTRDYEISIEVSEDRLREYGLSFDQVANAVRRGSMNLSAGTIRTKDEEIRLRTIGRSYTGADFAKIVVLAKPDGDIITLDRVADIRDGFTEDPIDATFNGEPAVLLGIFKTQEEDAIGIADTVFKYLKTKEETLPAGVHISPWSNRSKLIRDRIALLGRNGIVGLLLVIVLLWVFLDLRLSFWVSMGIPISLSGAMALLYMIGSTINMISLFGLIMVLGIIVDDAIIVGEAIYVHRKNGDPPLTAAVNGVCEVGLPVIAAVTTTIVAFIPLAFVGGVMGKFIAILPVVVIAALLVSLVESLFTLPAHLSHLPDMNAEIGPGHPWKQRAKRLRRGISNGMEYFAEHIYRPFAERTIRWRYIGVSIAICAVFLSIGIFRAGFLHFVMFSDVDGNDIVATIEFPQGTPFNVTRDAVVRTRKALERVAANMKTVSGKPLIENVYAVTGEAGEGFEARQGPNLGSVRVELLPTEDRGIHSEDINVAWEKETGPIPGAVSQTFSGLQHGPPGSDIEVWLQGENMDTLLAAAEEIKAKLHTFKGLYQIEDDFRPGKNELQFNLKPEARALGLTLDDLARQVYAGYFGEEALRLQRGRDDIRVRVRYTEDERKTIADLDKVRIRTAQGYEVPLFSVADVRSTRGYSSITRVDGLRLVKVLAAVNPKEANADEVLNKMDESFLPDLRKRIPGFTYSFEGPRKDSRDAIGGLFIGFPIALFGIYIIVATMFRSYIQPLIVMVTVPFGLIGAMLGHLALGYDLTLMSVFGMVALAGVVVNDAIVLIECFNALIAEGVPFSEALPRAGARRFRAVMLTTVTTVGGLMPLIMEQDLQAQFLIPMAITIAAGVTFATLLTLLFIPCMLGVLSDFRRIFHYLRYRVWVPAEDLEPARKRNIDETASGSSGMTPQTVAIGK